MRRSSNVRKELTAVPAGFASEIVTNDRNRARSSSLSRFALPELNPGDDVSAAHLVAGVAIEHDARGVVDLIVGLLAAGAEVDGEHAGLVRVDGGDETAARRAHLDRLARLRQRL